MVVSDELSMQGERGPTVEHAPPFLKELFSFTAVMRVLSAKRDRTEKIAQRVKIMLG